MTSTYVGPIGTTFSSVYSWGKAHGPEPLRQMWRLAGPEMRKIIEAAAEQLRHEATERQYHRDVQAAERAEDEAVAAYKARRDSAVVTRQGHTLDRRPAGERSTTARPDWAAVKAAGAKLPALPHAHYAVEEDGELHFFRIDKPQEGRWVGRTFVKIQASEEYYPIKDAARLVRILEAVAVDPQAAMLRYGREIGRCGHCHRTLTNPESIQYGIGPICRSKMGW